MRLTAAVVGHAHGLRGEVTLDVRTDDPGRLRPASVLDTDSAQFPRLTVAGVRRHQGHLLASFDEVASREDAESLRGARLLVEESAEEDAWYPHELEGLRALTPTGRDLGVVVGLQPGPAQDLLLVRHGGRTVMVPFVRELVPEVDTRSGTVTIDAPPGLFDPGEAVDAGDDGAAAGPDPEARP